MELYRAVKYIRLSYTDDRTVESDSVGNQRRMIDDFIAKHPEIEAVAEKVDDGYSGVLFDRPAFQEMMEMIRRGEVNCVIVKDLSRLGREYIETGRYMRRVFPAYGVRFIAINDHVDTAHEEADDLAVSVKNIMNEAYPAIFPSRPGAPWKPNGATEILSGHSAFMGTLRPANSIKS